MCVEGVGEGVLGERDIAIVISYCREEIFYLPYRVTVA